MVARARWQILIQDFISVLDMANPSVMKKLFSLALLLIATLALGQIPALQADNQIDKDATAQANKLCNCIEGIVKEFHPTLRDLMKDMVEKGEAEAQKKFAEKLMAMTEEEQKKVMTDIERMQNFETEMAKKCGDLEAEYSMYENNATFEAKMLEALKNLPECGFSYQMMLLGTKK
jgi:polyhydroxyalkanoate synthesis regulator phasin